MQEEQVARIVGCGVGLLLLLLLYWLAVIFRKMRRSTRTKRPLQASEQAPQTPAKKNKKPTKKTKTQPKESPVEQDGHAIDVLVEACKS
mmetsp:Transcript_9411/g.15357  ORF Transcript_9411/g.15357 Transcript_9411/m.15357 type:complete len:89 (-) Transcript_9411:445-711(-)